MTSRNPDAERLRTLIAEAEDRFAKARAALLEFRRRRGTRFCRHGTRFCRRCNPRVAARWSDLRQAVEAARSELLQLVWEFKGLTGEDVRVCRRCGLVYEEWELDYLRSKDTCDGRCKGALVSPEELAPWLTREAV